MIQPGQVVLFKFPQTDLDDGKLRPALLLGKLPGNYNDWLICMISSQLRHTIADFDEIIDQEDADFANTGLKVTSLIRIGRLAVINEEILLGTIGSITPNKLQRIKTRLANWLTQ
jgi:mRNA interferase MazF